MTRRPAKSLVAAALLAALAAALYIQAAGFEFINYDEGVFVVRNPRIREGLTVDGIRWAFTTPHAIHYIPLTWISFMADATLHGMEPAGFHIANVALHAANTALLLLVLLALTGAAWPCALTAALFAVHPLNVESVAWVYERKGLLSAFFCLVTLLAYTRYLRRPSLPRRLAVAACFLPALLSKPAAIGLPVLLLILDWWPLGRLGGHGNRKNGGRFPPFRPLLPLVIEKVPLFLLSAAFGVVVLLIFREEEFLVNRISVWGQAANSLVSYFLYLWKMVWPARLIVIYMIPQGGHPWWRIALAASALAAISLGVLAAARRRPYLAAGWLWYLALMFPAIGLLNTGFQAMADRYAYLPLIGVFLAASWGAAGAARERPGLGKALPVVALALLVTLAGATTRQLPYWRNSETLFRRALQLDNKNWIAWNNLGNAVASLGRPEEAAVYFRESASLNYRHTEAFYNLGRALADLGRNEEAVDPLRQAILLKPSYAAAHYNLGIVYERLGRYQEAIGALRESIRLRPDSAADYLALGLVNAKLGSLPEARDAFREAVRLKPDSADAHYNLGYAHSRLGERELALEQYRVLARLDPKQAERLLRAIPK